MNPLFNFLSQFVAPPAYHRNRAHHMGRGHKAARAGQQYKQVAQRRHQTKAAKKTRQMQRRQSK